MRRSLTQLLVWLSDQIRLLAHRIDRNAADRWMPDEIAIAILLGRALERKDRKDRAWAAAARLAGGHLGEGE